MNILHRFLELFGESAEDRARAKAHEEALRLKIVERCRQFRRLLARNKSALELMSDMEAHLEGTRHFDMDYVRSSGQKVTSAVHQMVQCLQALGGHSFTSLEDAFARIDAQISHLLAQTDTQKPFPEAPLTLPLSAIRLDHARVVGGKMANLGEIQANVGLSVPNGFAITVSAYDHFMASNDLARYVHEKIESCDLTSLDEAMRLSQDLQAAILSAPLPSDLETAIVAAVDALLAQEGESVLLALRSSAIGEDSKETTFAGQYRSELNVPPEEACHVWKEIIASKYSLSAMSYRLQKGIPDASAPMCVGVLAMVQAVCGGVAYSRNPVATPGKEDCVVINAVKGLPESVVDGASIPDVFLCSHAEPPVILERRTERNMLHGIMKDEQICHLAHVTLALEEYYAEPQDVEWALNQKGELIILQSRPLQIASQEESEGENSITPDSDAVILAQGGIPASSGVSIGQPCILRKEADMFSFPGGGIMVVERAFPRWATLLPRAKGLISETGGAAGHLASVAREYKIPALFSLKNACSLLANQGEITLDAGRARVYLGRHEELLPKKRRDAAERLQKSQAYQELVKLCELVTPLHLLDPQSPDFRAEKCSSLHDITRFCHENAVNLLFDSQDTQGEKIGKQLKVGAKLQYWIVDMGHAFSHTVDGPVVDLKEILSVPMLALWDGMTAIPWLGPPSAGAAGFMSVVLESTMNPELESTAPTTMTERNFFILDRDYMILQARYGYHFCTVECRACEKRSENFVTFQFKGGAADRERRILRVKMLAGLLEEFQFRVDVREDALSAVAEGFSYDNTLRRTCLLGYLLIHSRQSDTIMLDGSRAGAFRAKLLSDMQTVFQKQHAFLKRKGS
ncbi:MAG: phosphoenolpyruvate synthase [Desulfovibrio sp.]|nr:phosphoenolpyruvate synthase [Desulfovibrio sp.]